MIPGEHRQFDPGDPRCRDRISNARAGWIVQPDQTEQLQLDFGPICVSLF